MNGRSATSKPLGGSLHFLWACLIKQQQTGSILPSQRFLIAKMIAPVPKDYSGQIIELGPGNGALTVRLAARCPRARILACEINPVLARDTRANLAAAGLEDRVEVVSDSAEHLLEERVRSGTAPADFIISGIPIGHLHRDKTYQLIDAIHGGLRKRGMYIQFQYSLIDRKKIKERFSRLRTAPALLNFPPAIVYYAWK